MGKNNIENSLKRFLKRKVKITLGLVVAFMITGVVSFGADKPVEEMNNFEKAEYYLKELGKSNIKQGEYKDSTGKYTITVAENGDISFSGFDTNGDGKEDVIPQVSNSMISKITKELLESGALSGDLKVTDKESNEVNTEIIAMSQGQNGTDLKNMGIILANSTGQYLNYGNNAINYGIIVVNGTVGENTGGQVSLASTKGTLENYGVIVSETNGQYLQSKKDEAENKAYNFGYIQSKKAGQRIGHASGIVTNNANMYNYGILNVTDGNGQEILISNSGNVTNSEIRNYGLIEANKFAQSVTGATNSAYNYGIIKGANNGLVEVKDGAKAYNNGIIINTAGTEIFSNSADNKANVINNGMLVINGDSITDNFTNGGVVLNSSFELVDRQGINKDVVELSNGQNITNDTVGDITTGKASGYIKNGSVTIEENLSNKNLNAVVTQELGKAVFTYENADNKNFSLINTSVTGYFQKAGTLLDVKSGEIFTIAGDSKVTAIKDKGLTGEDVTAVNLSNGAILNIVGEAEIVGKVVGAEAGIGMTANNGGKDSAGNRTSKTEADRAVKTIMISNADQNLINNNVVAEENNYTDIIFKNTEVDDFKINFGITAKDEANKIVLGEKVYIKNGIDGSSTKENNDLQLEISNISNIGGDIKLGASDDSITIDKYETYDKAIDMGEGNDSFTVNGFAQNTTKASDNHKELGTFNYNLVGVETITLKGGKSTDNVNKGWHIGEQASVSGVDKATLKLDNTELHVDMNNNYGKGNVTTSLDNFAKEGTELALTTENGGAVKFTVGDKFNVAQKEFDVATNYDISGVQDDGLQGAVIFDVSKVNEKDVHVRVKEASELGLENYKGIYNAVLGALADTKYEDIRNTVNYAKADDFVDLISNAGNTAEAFYTTGYAVTKDVTDTYISVVEDFGRKAGKGEWIAYGKYVNSDTEFDGGNKSKGYDGDITGTVGMVEYGVSDVTSYGVVYGQGDTEVNINGGGKLDGDNQYVGGYIKHRTENGIDLIGNIGFTKSELDLDFATSTIYQQIISSGTSDTDAKTFSLRGKKDYRISDSVILQPVAAVRYSLIQQDAVESSDANFRMDEQDVTIFEGAFGGNLIKEYELSNGRLALSVGAEYVMTNVSKSDDARYKLYEQDIELTGEDDVADNKIEAHIGAEYIHENGVGFDVKYEAVFTDKGDSDRVTAGVSYRF